MGDVDILKSLREQVLDESQSLVGLLRRCLALGAVTGSEELRAWASNELKGYADGTPLPSYRLMDAPMFINQMGGNTYVKGQAISRYQIPSDLRDFVPEKIDFRQPVEELSQLAASSRSSQKMSRGGFSLLAAEWSKKLDMFQSISSIYYEVSTSAIAGMVGMIRTTLVEIVIELAKDVPLDSLPSKEEVDGAVHLHINSNSDNSINIAGSNSGIVGQGAGSTQIQNNSAPTELTAVIDKLRAALDTIDDDDQRADAEQAIDDFEDSASADNPEAEKVKRRWRIIERVGTALGSAVLTEAVKQGAPAVTDFLQLMM